MQINLIGKFANTWGAEWMIKRGFESLGHEVNGLNLAHGYSLLRNIKSGALTIVIQGYGQSPKLFESIRRITKNPVVLWHAEVMSPEWPTTDDVVLAKASQLQPIAVAFDAIGHNCHCCLSTIEALGGRNVFWAPNNGVDVQVHRRIEGIQKRYAIGAYGYLSPRRVELLNLMASNGIDIEYRRPEDGCFGEDLIRFINQCHLILNFHYSASPNTECRLYEALGCGVPVISEPISMPELFPQESCGIMYFLDMEQLVMYATSVVNLSRTRPDMLTFSGTAAMTWLHANASYAQRCQTFLDRIKEVLAHGVTW